MTDKKQPEALRMALDLEALDLDGIAAELCRLHAENEALHAERERNLNSIRVCNEIINKKNAELESLTTGYAAARLEIESLQARIKTMAEEHADELMVAHMDGRSQAAQPAGAQQPAKAESLRQILTDPENQPNQYGVQFLMHGAKMAFRIGNRQFCLDYEPDEPGEFEFMRDALISAFSIFTPDVKLAQQPSPTPQADSQPAPVQDMAVMQLAESVGLIGPASRTHDLHAAVQRFHDLICANATIKAAQMAAEAISEAAPQQRDAQEPVAWYVTGCGRLLDEDEAKAEARHIGGTARAIPLYTAPQADSQPAVQQGDATRAAARALSDRVAEMCNVDKEDHWKYHSDDVLSDAELVISTYLAARAPADSVLEDAERYRWLRQEHERVDPVCHLTWKRNLQRDSSEWVNTAVLDTAIDNARKQGANHD